MPGGQSLARPPAKLQYHCIIKTPYRVIIKLRINKIIKPEMNFRDEYTSCIGFKYAESIFITLPVSTISNFVFIDIIIVYPLNNFTFVGIIRRRRIADKSSGNKYFLITISCASTSNTLSFDIAYFIFSA